ncbi:hypothetical protein [Haliangium sp.]|uniref:hypothetical protein n=1 Tax=Haliangium sp. TaxID=2663208 RepID=UPI003D12D28C
MSIATETARRTAAGFIAAALMAGCDPAPPRIEAITVLGPTIDTAGPYTVEAVVTGVVDEIVELRYRDDEQRAYVHRAMFTDDRGELYRGAIPGYPTGTTVDYYLAVVDDGQVVNTDPEAGEAAPYTFTIVDPPVGISDRLGGGAQSRAATR